MAANDGAPASPPITQEQLREKLNRTLGSTGTRLKAPSSPLASIEERNNENNNNNNSSNAGTETTEETNMSSNDFSNSNSDGESNSNTETIGSLALSNGNTTKSGTSDSFAVSSNSGTQLSNNSGSEDGDLQAQIDARKTQNREAAQKSLNNDEKARAATKQAENNTTKNVHNIDPSTKENKNKLKTFLNANNDNNNNSGNAGTGPGFKSPSGLDSTPIVPDGASASASVPVRRATTDPVERARRQARKESFGLREGRPMPVNATANLKLPLGYNRPDNKKTNSGIELTSLPTKKIANNNQASRAAAIAAAKEELAAKKAKNAIKKEENNAEVAAAAKKANNNKTPKGSNNTTPKSNKSNKSNNKVTPKQYSKNNISKFTQKLNVLSRNLQAKQRSFKTPNRAATIKSINSNKQTLKGKTGMSSNVIRNSLTKIKNKYANVNTGKRLTLSGGKRTTFKKSTALKTRRSMKKQRETK